MPVPLQSIIQSATPGSTVTVPTGTYETGDLAIPDDIALQAEGDVTLVGDMTVSGQNTTLSGFTFSGGTVDIGGSVGATIQNCVFNGGDTSIALDGARDALITNNAFHDVSGGVLIGWGLDQSTISNNEFYDCYQPIDLLFNNNSSEGRDITIADNYFTGTGRMPIEVGPTGAYTANLVVEGNRSENMNNVGQQNGYHTDVAYSVVPTNGVDTLIEGNHAAGPGTGVGIELAGSGEIAGNHVTDFWYGVIVYDDGFVVHDNTLVNQSIEPVLNYAGRSGEIYGNRTGSRSDEVPASDFADATGADPDATIDVALAGVADPDALRSWDFSIA